MDSNSTQFTRYVILLSRADAPLTEVAIRAHVAHLERLDAAGSLVLCGPFTDYDGGMVVIRAESLAAARAIAEADPFVRDGLETYELRTWELSCAENDHMGLGTPSKS